LHFAKSENLFSLNAALALFSNLIFRKVSCLPQTCNLECKNYCSGFYPVCNSTTSQALQTGHKTDICCEWEKVN